MDDLLRDTFARHEDLVPVAAGLRPAIASGARRRRLRRRWTWSCAAAVVVAALFAAPLALPDRPSTHNLLLAGPVKPLHFLLLGTDRRQGDVGAQVRADAIILLHVDPAARTAYQVSIPRDLLLDLPGFGAQKAGGAYVFGGYSLTAQSVTGLTGIPIDAGAVVDFAGMEAVTKAVGGIDLCVDQRTESAHLAYDAHGGVVPRSPGSKPVVYEVGCRHFAAYEALDYLRQPTSVSGSDDRDRHLRQYLAALARQLSDPGKLAKLLPVAGKSLDLHLGDMSLTSLTAVLGQLDSTRIPGVRLPSRLDGASLRPLPGGDGLYTALRTATVPAWLSAHPQYVT
jgi:LCP family protein required for cell wall assembly